MQWYSLELLMLFKLTLALSHASEKMEAANICLHFRSSAGLVVHTVTVPPPKHTRLLREVCKPWYIILSFVSYSPNNMVNTPFYFKCSYSLLCTPDNKFKDLSPTSACT